LQVREALFAGPEHGVCVPVHGRDNVLLKHCVRAVAPATEFGNPVGHAVHAAPLAKKFALHIKELTGCVQAAAFVAHPSRCVPSPLPAALENTV